MNILKRPMLLAAVVCSIVAAASLFIKTIAFALLGISVLCTLVIILLKRYKYITVTFFVLLFTVSLCFQFFQIKTISVSDNKIISGKFLVISESELYDDFNMVALKSTSSNVLPKGTKYLVFDEKKTKLKMGDIVNAKIKISVIDNYDEYRFTNYSNGIYATANAEKISKTDNYNVVYKSAGNIRSYVKKTISSKFKNDTAGFLLAVTTGDKSLLSDQFLEHVKTTGISHMIVVSGMHLSIIMMAVFWCLDRLFYNKYIRAFISVMLVLSIFVVCGFTMSITRAGAMFIVAAIAPIFNRDNDSLNSLLTAVVVVLIGAPFAIFNISFQLSVLSTLSIVWVVPFYYQRITKKFSINNKFIKLIVATVLCSVFAIIFTLPVTIKTFGFVSIISPITNLLVTYPVNLALVLTILSLALNVIPIIKIVSFVPFRLAKWCAEFVVYIVNVLAQLPITVAVLPKSAFWWSIVIIVLIIGNMHWYEYKKKRSDLNANSFRRRFT